MEVGGGEWRVEWGWRWEVGSGVGVEGGMVGGGGGEWSGGGVVEVESGGGVVEVESGSGGGGGWGWEWRLGVGVGVEVGSGDGRWDWGAGLEGGVRTIVAGFRPKASDVIVSPLGCSQRSQGVVGHNPAHPERVKDEAERSGGGAGRPAIKVR